ncbi:hypothetical protein MNBD_NITROSPINAE04-2281 [hydrothermal vent metagenome]|uniref:Phosphoglycerate mutase family protein n=1 Tax=hydrothermal vent metagenome TaxID=652676 RepID=A0A3B1C738_9ZZZZ
MHILLARHGPPNVENARSLLTREMSQWIADYNRAGLAKLEKSPAKNRSMPVKCALWYSSDLPRAVDSAIALGIKPTPLPLFREADLPHLDIPYLRLPPLVWVGLFRLVWFAGYGKDEKSIDTARARSVRACRLLIDQAIQKGSVGLMGHGVMNKLIERNLRAEGWKRSIRSKNSYWSHALYRLG